MDWYLGFLIVILINSFVAGSKAYLAGNEIRLYCFVNVFWSSIIGIILWIGLRP